MEFPFLGFGVGLRTVHYETILREWPAVDWFEIISENYMVEGGRPLHTLDRIRERYPVVMHGVSLSIGSTDPLNTDYLQKLKRLADRIQPAWISDHLCWTGVGGHNLHDLLPLPYTEEALNHVSDRIHQVQEYLGRPLVIENVSSYLEFSNSNQTEWDFLNTLSEKTGCHLLLDVNNVHVSAVNHGFNSHDFLEGLTSGRIAQIHLAGHTDKGTHLLDTHDHPVADAVWKLYEEALRKFGPLSTLIEWDDAIPELGKLLEEAQKARDISDRLFNAN